MTLTSSPTSDPVLVGAGDIAGCNSNGDEATVSLLDGIDGKVFTTGDNAYPDGTTAEFSDCYDPSWGRHKARTFPSAGNHDYHTTDAAGYFSYFGPVAGKPTEGYYSYDLGTWHIIVLNSNISVDAGSAQEQWLRSDLAAHPSVCTAAYWHHPRFSSGVVHGSNAQMQPLWQALYDYGARATDQVEAAIARTRGSRQARHALFEAVAEAFRPASRAFRDDITNFHPATEIYEQNTLAAARRVRELIDEGTRAGAFRRVQAAFVGEVVTPRCGASRAERSQRLTGSATPRPIGARKLVVRASAR